MAVTCFTMFQSLPYMTYVTKHGQSGGCSSSMTVHFSRGMASEYLRVQESVPGWFYLEDVELFQHINEMQIAARVTGDLLEIGAYQGKSAILLGCFTQDNEQLVICDLFERSAELPANQSENEEWYSGLSRQLFERQYLRFHNALPRIVSCDSLRLIRTGRLSRTFRFIHVDGSHLYSVVKRDILTARRLLKKGGVVAFDDYRSEHTPGVAAAVWEAVIQGGLIPLFLTPQKLYGTWDPFCYRLLKEIKHWCVSRFEVSPHSIHGRTVLRLKMRESG